MAPAQAPRLVPVTSDPAPAHPAATVVLTRDTAESFEVLMLRRTAALAFLAGVYVFPGGRVDDADRVHAAGDEGGALRIAAVRELVEEAGILLARRGSRWATSEEADRVRAALRDGDTLAASLGRDGLEPAIDVLLLFGRIVTPQGQPKRFDTHFLVAALPAGQAPSHDAGETDDIAWVEPGRATDPAWASTLQLAPPTWFTLALVGHAASSRALRDWAAARDVVRIEPHLELTASGRRVTFPNEPELSSWHGPDGIVFDAGKEAWSPPPTGRLS
ncbi:MAG: NUDIX domain-containing protein [Actinobacteria bacterium]|nr:NUDIX domain-containing protein [Actinomycetota bacterium]